MDEVRVTAALDRAERALARIERSLQQSSGSNGRDERLRQHVKEAVAELDKLIREAAH